MKKDKKITIEEIEQRIEKLEKEVRDLKNLLAGK